MKNDDFWSVELGVGMGPLVLGTDFESLRAVLQENRIDVNSLTLNRSNEMAVPEIGIHCLFSNTNPRTLIRIDVSDERLRFGSLPVIGKRAHEIVGLFKVPRKETLWCDIENNDLASATSGTKSDITAMSRELLARGTIWITGLGLGLKLRDGLVEIVHLCDPSQSPQAGNGLWTKEQQRLSEVRELPAASTAPTARNRKSVSIFNVLIHVALVAALGTLVWWAVQLQQRWDAAIEVPATVVALNPPPPNPLPDKVTVSFKDVGGNEQRHTLGFMQFMMTPKMGDEVKVKFLPESPDQVLGPVAFRNVGFETAFPYGIGLLAIYSLLQLILFGRSRYRRRRRRK